MKTFFMNPVDRMMGIYKVVYAKNRLCGNSWYAYVDGGLNEVYKFNEDGTLIISSGGVGKEYKWKFYDNDKSIVIYHEDGIYTFRAAFEANSVLALQLEGTSSYVFLVDAKWRDEYSGSTGEELVSKFESMEYGFKEEEKKRGYASVGYEEKERQFEKAKKEIESLLQERFVHRYEKKTKVIYIVFSLLLIVLMVPWDEPFRDIIIPFIVVFLVWLVIWLKVKKYIENRACGFDDKMQKEKKRIYKKYQIPFEYSESYNTCGKL